MLKDYKPEFMVGIDGIVLGETITKAPNIEYYDYHFLQDTPKETPLGGYYLKKFNDQIFEKYPYLEFEKRYNTLISVSFIVKEEYKDLMYHQLEKKYGFNRKNEWHAPGLYRTEVWNKYGTIFILFDKSMRAYKEKAKSHFIEDKLIYEDILVLKMWFHELDSTKTQLDQIKFRHPDLSQIDLSLICRSA